MVGLERSILSVIAEREFQFPARTAVLSFIVVFGVTKAVTNYLAGRCTWRVPSYNGEPLGQVLKLAPPNAGIQREAVEQYESGSISAPTIADAMSVYVRASEFDHDRFTRSVY